MTELAVWLGTLILFVPTPGGALVSADSRFEGGDPARRDQARKIFLCGRAAVCAISGGLRLDVAAEDGAGSVDIAALLDETSRRMRAADDQRAESLLDTLRDSMQRGIAAFWSRYLSSRRVAAPMSLRLGAPSVCTVLFAAPGRLAQIQFQFSERKLSDGSWIHELRHPVMRAADPARPLAQGRTECALAPEKLPGTADELEALYQPARESPFCRDVIGGPVDVAAIEAGEARWLRVKPPLSPAEKIDQAPPLPVH